MLKNWLDQGSSKRVRIIELLDFKNVLRDTWQQTSGYNDMRTFSFLKVLISSLQSSVSPWVAWVAWGFWYQANLIGAFDWWVERLDLVLLLRLGRIWCQWLWVWVRFEELLIPPKHCSRVQPDIVTCVSYTTATTSPWLVQLCEILSWISIHRRHIISKECALGFWFTYIFVTTWLQKLPDH